jgi:two-component system response regulator HydG
MSKLGFFKAIIAVSFVAVLMLSAYAIFVLRPSFANLITENSEAEAVRLAIHLSRTLIKDKTINDKFIFDQMEIAKENLNANFDIELEELQKDFGIMKVKLFSPDGEIIYSTDPKDVGKTNTKLYFQEFAKKGLPYTKVIKKNSRSLEDQIVAADVVETYVPIMREDNFLGAFEIYFDITAAKGKLDRLVLKSLLVSLPMAFGMLLIVIVISLKATKSIISQFSAKTKDSEEAHQRLLTVLESLDAGVYVADIETYEVLFVNKYLKDIFGDTVGKICYKALRSNKSGPCEFCTIKKLLTSDGKPTGVNVWEFQNTLTGEWYEIHDRAIYWINGRIGRLEIASDITDRKHTEMELKQAHKEMGTFCEILKQIGTEQTLDGVGTFLMRELKGILNTKYLVLYVFSSDQNTLFSIWEGGYATIKEPKLIQTASSIFEKIQEATITSKKMFEPPLLPEYFPGEVEQIIIPLQIRNHADGALIFSCVPGCLCDGKTIDLVALILEQVSGTIKRTVLHHEEILELESRIKKTSEFVGIIDKDLKMKTIYKTIDDIAPTDATVLIQGETGTGKEMVANAIWQRSRRKDKPFIVIDCSAYPDTLIESEFFGHEIGTFTGATRQKPGRFEQADGGTVFLDEVSEIHPSAQMKLLRVLQSQKFERLGGEQTLSVDVRILAATNKDLFQEVKNGNFREDLYYRLNVIPVNLPPLRMRSNDIILLAQHFQRKFASQHGETVKGFSSKAVQRLLDYHWPGNVRELENSIEHAVVLSKGRQIEISHLPSSVLSDEHPSDIEPAVKNGTIIDNERRLLMNVLEECNWNKTQAARRLGISRQAVYDKLKRYQIDKPIIQ